MRAGELKKQTRYTTVLTWLIPSILATLTGCESVNDWMTAERVDYHNAKVGPTLAVPKDLTPVPQNQHFVLPDTVDASIAPSPATRISTTSNVASKQTMYRVPSPSTSDARIAAMHIEVEPSLVQGAAPRYWLVLPKAQLDTLWPQLRTFWKENGFTMQEDQPKLGWLETDWAENRAQIPNDWLRRFGGKWLDSLYSSGTLDKFRTIVEPDPSAGVRLLIVHYGMEEVLVGRKDSSIWQERARNPELEKTFLSLLMQSWGASEEAIQTAMAQAKPIAARVAWKKSAIKQDQILLKEPWDKAGLRLEMALDRMNAKVLQSDPLTGKYIVQLADEAHIREQAGVSKAWFASRAKREKHYQIVINKTPAPQMVAISVNATRTSPNAASSTTADAQKVLVRLFEQLEASY